MIKNKIKKVINWISNYLKDENQYKIITCEDLPDLYVQDILYLVGEDKVFWQAAMLCPCRCGDLIQLNLDTKGKPKWQVFINKKSQPTIRPSVHRKINCKSHFLLTKGKVLWCNNDY